MTWSPTVQPAAASPAPAMQPMQAPASQSAPTSTTLSAFESPDAVYQHGESWQTVSLYDVAPTQRANMAEAVAAVFARNLTSPMAIHAPDAGTASADVQAINMTGAPPAQPDPVHLIAQAAYQMITDGLPTHDPVVVRG